MANTFSPFGFRSFGHQDGSAPTMGLQAYIINSSYATAIFTGDPVSLSTASGFEGTLTIGAVANGTAKNLGVFAGCEYYLPALQRQTWSAYFPGSVGSSSPCIGYVITDPEMVYLAQASSGTAVGSSLTGWNIAFTLGTGNTTTGQSNSYLNSSQVGASSSYPWRVVGAYANSGNNVGVYSGPPGINGTSTDGGGYLVVQMNGGFRNTVSVTGVST